MSLAPDQRLRRSAVYRELVALDASFAEINGAACAMTCGGSAEAEAERAQDLAICDLSPLPRACFKGHKAVAWVAAQGVTVTEANNMTAWQEDGACAARLADTEVLLLGALACESTLCERIVAGWSPDPDPGAYPVPRADTNCWFLISGRHSATMFSKICGVDLRPDKFAVGAIAQTSIARLTGIVIRADVDDTLAYHFLSDNASASYMWDCLLDAMGEWGGAPVGLDAMRGLAGERG
jgi:sarcosine oxidase subunit gamma